MTLYWIDQYGKNEVIGLRGPGWRRPPQIKLEDGRIIELDDFEKE